MLLAFVEIQCNAEGTTVELGLYGCCLLGCGWRRLPYVRKFSKTKKEERCSSFDRNFLGPEVMSSDTTFVCMRVRAFTGRARLVDLEIGRLYKRGVVKEFTVTDLRGS